MSSRINPGEAARGGQEEYPQLKLGILGIWTLPQLYASKESSFVPFVLYVRMPQAEGIKKRHLNAGAFYVKQVHCIMPLLNRWISLKWT